MRQERFLKLHGKEMPKFEEVKAEKYELKAIEPSNSQPMFITQDNNEADGMFHKYKDKL